MAEAKPKTTKTTKVARDKMRRPVKPGTLLVHILEYTRANEISTEDAIQTMIDNLRDDIVAEEIGELG